MFKAGQLIRCRVTARERDGFTVEIGPDKLPGFLATKEELSIDSEVEALFVCRHQERFFLTDKEAIEERALLASQGAQETSREEQPKVEVFAKMETLNEQYSRAVASFSSRATQSQELVTKELSPPPDISIEEQLLNLVKMIHGPYGRKQQDGAVVSLREIYSTNRETPLAKRLHDAGT